MAGEYGNIAQSLFTPVHVGQNQGELTEQQKEQKELAGSMAKIQFASSYPVIQQKYLDARTDFIKTYADMYKKNRNRQILTGRGLSPQDQMTIEGKKQELLNQVAWGNRMEKDLDAVNNDAITAIKAGELSSEDYSRWWNDYQDKLKGAKSGAEIPNVRADYANFANVHKIVKPPKSEDVVKNVKEALDLVTHGFENTKGELTKENKESIARNIDALPQETLDILGGKGKNPDEQKRVAYQRALDYRKQGDPNSLGWFNAMTREQHYDEKQTEKTQGINIEPAYDVGNKTKSWDVGTYNIPYTGKVYDAQNSKWVTGKGKVEQVIDRNGGKELKVSVVDPADKDHIVIGHAPYQADIKTKLKGVGKGVNLQDFDEKPVDNSNQKPSTEETSLKSTTPSSQVTKDPELDKGETLETLQSNEKKMTESLDKMRKSDPRKGKPKDSDEFKEYQKDISQLQDDLSNLRDKIVRVGRRQDKVKNPNYKGYDKSQVTDKSGKLRNIVWDDTKGNYVYAD